MKILKIIAHIAVLYGFYFVGSLIQAELDLFIPGSIIGMVLLFLALTFKLIKDSWIEEGTQFLIKDMPLLFVPITVGIINYLELFSGKGFSLILIVLISTALVMISSGLTAQFFLLRKAKIE
ncbi:CidA/LrgA family protein [Aquibacillus saliphilus]|uniref:CidA/LrgA family protein n=1 Tax=Aquibacillus saliphilus TaxID=1909422 RepID=UPI001CEFE1B5|nr:CidA/LrgA family protein [Aquibacillus saliphilus]